MKPEQEAPSREPWAQLPRMPGQRRETDVAYAAFQVYYRLPPGERSARLTAIKVGKSKKLIEDWSRFHHWVERAKAWDDHLARIADQQLEQKAREEAEKWAKRREQQREQDFEDAQALRRRARNMLDYPFVEQNVTGPDGRTVHITPAKWHAGMIADIFVKASGLSRSAIERDNVIQDQVQEKIELEGVPLDSKDKDPNQ